MEEEIRKLADEHDKDKATITELQAAVVQLRDVNEAAKQQLHIMTQEVTQLQVSLEEERKMLTSW